MQSHQPPRLDLPPEESTDLEELEQFAKMFKQKRIKLGTCNKICIELGMTAKSFHDNTLPIHLKRFKFLGYTQGDVQIPREGIHISLQFKGKFNFVHLNCKGIAKSKAFANIFFRYLQHTKVLNFYLYNL